MRASCCLASSQGVQTLVPYATPGMATHSERVIDGAVSQAAVQGLTPALGGCMALGKSFSVSQL